jgi:ABC-type transporter Mla maintaining outer membrane lipid asymmetry ATPase subunit MlaF
LIALAGSSGKNWACPQDYSCFRPLSCQLDLQIIKITDIHKSFRTDVVLRGFCFEGEKGEGRVIIGGSGSGKSVILKGIVWYSEPEEEL